MVPVECRVSSRTESAPRWKNRRWASSTCLENISDHVLCTHVLMATMWLACKAVSARPMEGGPEANRFANRTVSLSIRLQIGFGSYDFFAFLSVYCLQPPVIEHARHSALPEQATFDLDSTVQYHCHTGYATAGFPRAKCLAVDGQASWYGPDISCERELKEFGK